MSPTTHLLASWCVAQAVAKNDRDRKIIAWAGILPDLDGLGLGIDLANVVLSRPETDFYGRFHHLLLHGCFGVVLLCMAAVFLAKDKTRTALWVCLIVHLHLLADFLGARGPTPTDLWPIHYLAPFSHRWTLYWKNQWPLDGWQNILITLALLLLIVSIARRQRCSPMEMVSTRWDQRMLKAFGELRFIKPCQ